MGDPSPTRLGRSSDTGPTSVASTGAASSRSRFSRADVSRGAGAHRTSRWERPVGPERAGLDGRAGAAGSARRAQRRHGWRHREHRPSLDGPRPGSARTAARPSSGRERAGLPSGVAQSATSDAGDGAASGSAPACRARWLTGDARLTHEATARTSSTVTIPSRRATSAGRPGSVRGSRRRWLMAAGVTMSRRRCPRDPTRPFPPRARFGASLSLLVGRFRSTPTTSSSARNDSGTIGV